MRLSIPIKGVMGKSYRFWFETETDFAIADGILNGSAVSNSLLESHRLNFTKVNWLLPR